jgi:hypothetical protein
MKQLKHPNVVQLRHYFYQTTTKRREADGQTEEETFREHVLRARARARAAILRHALVCAPCAAGPRRARRGATHASAARPLTTALLPVPRRPPPPQ